MLSDVPPRVLADLCRTHGREHLLQQGRCRAMLADVCGSYHTEVFLLDCVARERLVKPVLAVGMPVEFAVSQLANQIAQALRIDAEAARWAAEAWAVAMSWSPDGQFSGKTNPTAFQDAQQSNSPEAHRILIEGILRAFRGSLGEVGTATDLDKTLLQAVSAQFSPTDAQRIESTAWGTVKYLSFTRQPRGLVFTGTAIHFLNPAADRGHQSGCWLFARLQETRPQRQGLQEIRLSAADDRMSLEATGIPVSTMLMFLDLVREVVGPFLGDHVLPTPEPPAGDKPTSRKRAKR